MTQLHLDLLNLDRLVSPIWSFGGAVASAALLARDDVRQHLLICRDELGFRHVRCAGMLCDAMGVATAEGKLDFVRIEQSLDWLMENNFLPFFQLSGMPASLVVR